MGPDDAREPGEMGTMLSSARPAPDSPLARKVGLTNLLAAVTGIPKAPTKVGRYVIEEKIGEGGMGIVYRARDELLDRTVALKILSGRLREDEQARLKREATALARLTHPGVVAVYDVGAHEGEPYIAMEHVPGASLRGWLEANPDAGWREIAGLFLQAAQGLSAAHRAGLVHRDFKPDNVLVDDRGRVRIADFGLARFSDDEELGDGPGAGTPAFLSPEQRAGRAADARSDQYSFCLSLLRALDPRVGQGRPKGVPAAVRALVARGLHQDPKARHADMDAVASALESALRQRPTDRAREILVDRVERFWTRGVLAASLGGAEPVDLPLRDVSDRVESALGNVLPDATGLSSRDLPNLLQRANGSLLILGAPGAGKTTVLLLLVRDLVTAARDDPDQPVPVVLNLTSYADFDGSLDDWIADELVTKYSMARSRSRAWLDNDELVLVLDGLDELAAPRRRACVEAINGFRRDHPVPMVVASREDAYAGVQIPLALGAAVRVEALDEAAVEALLSRRGDVGARIQAAIAEDEQLREQLRSPLMLALAALSDPRALERADDVRTALLDGYVEHMFAQRPGVDRGGITHGLRWLAATMRRLDRSELWIERIQADWIEHAWARVLAVVAGVALVLGCAFAINGSMTLAAGLFDRRFTNTVGLTLGALVWVFPYVRTLRVRPIEKLTWSLRKALIRTTIGVLVVVPTGMLVMSAGWIPALLAGSAGAAVGLFYGLEPSDAPNRVRPNQGIRQSLRNAIVIGSLASVGSFLLMGLLLMPSFESLVGVEAVVEAGANPGFAAACETAGCVGAALSLIFGGYAVLMHAGLRMVLSATSPLPLRLIPFLDAAVDVGLLRRVGGGYIFPHRTVLDHFAQLPSR